MVIAAEIGRIVRGAPLAAFIIGKKSIIHDFPHALQSLAYAFGPNQMNRVTCGYVVGTNRMEEAVVKRRRPHIHRIGQKQITLTEFMLANDIIIDLGIIIGVAFPVPPLVGIGSRNPLIDTVRIIEQIIAECRVGVNHATGNVTSGRWR